ncbi:endonuclease V [Sphingobacterium faecium]|uniref:endonuclease V n=1 Tax=Sphingobacterium faecium TaxID=34087 RepID=UPI0032088F5D
MLFAIDVYYYEDSAKIVGVLFDWKDQVPQRFIVIQTDKADDYVPGEFYKRELPCLLKIINEVDICEIEAIIVDGHIYIEEGLHGLGGKLYEALDQQVPIIGVAKNSFHSNKSTIKEVYRCESKKPLYVSSIGLPVEGVAEKVLNMSGKFRIPDILKQLDTCTKDRVSNS